MTTKYNSFFEASPCLFKWMLPLVLREGTVTDERINFKQVGKLYPKFKHKDSTQSVWLIHLEYVFPISSCTKLYFLLFVFDLKKKEYVI